MLTSKKFVPLIIAFVVWLILLLGHPFLSPFARLIFLLGIPFGAIFYARSSAPLSEHAATSVFGSRPQQPVGAESSVLVGQPKHGITPLEVTSARTRWPTGTVVAASVIFGIPALINASEKDGGGLLALCIGLWLVVILVTWARVAAWTKRRGPMGGRFDIGPDGIQVYTSGTPSLIKRSDIHLVEIFNGWTNQSTVSTLGMGVFVGTGTAGVAAGAAFGGLAGAAAIAGASHAKAERWNAGHAYQIRYRVSGKPYALAGGLSLSTAQEVFWHLTGKNPGD